MQTEIIAVGTELLLGQIANRNAQIISERLAAVGVDVMRHSTVGDNVERVEAAIRRGLSDYDAVIITGGLGPTHDDLTRESIAAATSRPLEHRPDLEAELKQFFEDRDRPMAELNLRQAYLPKGAESIPNHIGTAPGIQLEHEGKLILALPGPPGEMQAMLEDHVAPLLSKRAGENVLVSRSLKVAGMPEADVAAIIEPTVKALEGPDSATLAILASEGEVNLRITAKDRSHHAAFIKIYQVESRLRKVLGSAIFGGDDDTLEVIVGDLARQHNVTVAVAESFTGGLLTSRLIDAPDASEHVLAGYVAYSPEAKMADLGVPKEVIEKFGAVSPETAIAMAEGARKRAGADVGISTTGEAGPDPLEEPVGTMFFGLAWDGGSLAESQFWPGDRASVKRRGAQAAMNMLRLWLLEQPG